MRAAWYDRLGPAREVLQVGELDTPEPGPGEVRIRLHASAVNPSDVKRRVGLRGQPMEYTRVIPHSDGAGVIDRAGPGVPRSRIGERVWTYKAQRGRAYGTAAEYCALPADRAIHLPDNTSFQEGACLGIPAVTAHACVFGDGPVTGRTVLVTGGAGAVGYYAIQLAKWGGATVLATVSSSEKAEVAREAGADHVINYRIENVVERVHRLTGGAGVDRIVEVAFGANLDTSIEAIKPNGIISTYGSDAVAEPVVPVSAMMRKNITVRFILMYVLPSAAEAFAHRDIVACCEAGVLKHRIWRRYPLDEIAAAHKAQEQGEAIGKIVLDLP
jgi:NADPH2:quinone reductase